LRWDDEGAGWEMLSDRLPGLDPGPRFFILKNRSQRDPGSPAFAGAGTSGETGMGAAAP